MFHRFTYIYINVCIFAHALEIKLGKYNSAITDCDTVLEMEPENIKGKVEREFLSDLLMFL